MEEQWLPVPEYEGHYEVSSLGRVRSLKRLHTSGAIHIFTAAPDPKGYPTVQLRLNGERRAHRVHSLVLAAFVGPRPEGMEACHGDGTRSNNVLSNLRYATPKENQADRIMHGTAMSGERMPQSKLTREQVDYCRRVFAPRHREFGGAALGRKFGVSQSAISLAVHGRNWRGEGDGTNGSQGTDAEL